VKTYEVKIYFTSGQTVTIDSWQIDEKVHKSPDPITELLNEVKRGGYPFFSSGRPQEMISINVDNIDFTSSKEII